MVSHGADINLERYLTAAGVLRLVAVLALAFGVVVFLVLVAFLGAAVALAGVFFGAAAFFVAAGALGVVVFFGSNVSECDGDVICSWNHVTTHLGSSGLGGRGLGGSGRLCRSLFLRELHRTRSAYINTSVLIDGCPLNE